MVGKKIGDWFFVRKSINQVTGEWFFVWVSMTQVRW
jgi:hypothetical protein